MQPLVKAAPRAQSDFLVFATAPCNVALAADSVQRICDAKEWDASEWPSVAALPSLEQLLGVFSPHGGGAARRVLALGNATECLGLTIPQTLSVLPATEAQLLPLPELFMAKAFCAMLLWQDQPKALLIDSQHLRDQVSLVTASRAATAR